MWGELVALAETVSGEDVAVVSAVGGVDEASGVEGVDEASVVAGVEEAEVSDVEDAAAAALGSTTRTVRVASPTAPVGSITL